MVAIATEKQIKYAKAISEELNIPLPEKCEKDLYFKFISENNEKFKERKNAELYREKSFKRKNKKIIFRVNDYLMEALKNVENKHGIYIFWSNNELCYIGKSMDLGLRILSSLKERITLEQIIDEVSWCVTESVADMHILEPYLITKYKPKMNTEFMCEDFSNLFNCEIKIEELLKLKTYSEIKILEVEK